MISQTHFLIVANPYIQCSKHKETICWGPHPKHEIHFAHGSTHINQFEHEDEGMDCYNLMNEFVQKLHAKNRGVSSTQYNDKFQRGKKFGRGRGRGGLSGIDGEGEGK